MFSHTRMYCFVLRLLVCGITLPCLLGWKVLTLEEDRLARQKQRDNFDAAAFVSRIWENDVLGYAAQTAQPLTDLLEVIDADLGNAGETYGRQAGEGSPWTFLASGKGRVVAVNTKSRIGSVQVQLEGDEDSRIVNLLVGPAIFGTTLRDALPSINFNDFANQIAFAETGNALTARALQNIEPALVSLKVGSSVEFLGAFSLYGKGDDITLTPLELQAMDSAGN